MSDTFGLYDGKYFGVEVLLRVDIGAHSNIVANLVNDVLELELVNES